MDWNFARWTAAALGFTLEIGSYTFFKYQAFVSSSTSVWGTPSFSAIWGAGYRKVITFVSVMGLSGATMAATFWALVELMVTPQSRMWG